MIEIRSRDGKITTLPPPVLGSVGKKAADKAEKQGKGKAGDEA